jgi:hypothetical protein
VHQKLFFWTFKGAEEMFLKLVSLLSFAGSSKVTPNLQIKHRIALVRQKAQSNDINLKELL